MKNKQKSDCCGAKVRAVENTTKFYGCTACGEPCNLAHLGDTADMVDHTEDSHDMVELKSLVTGWDEVAMDVAGSPFFCGSTGQRLEFAKAIASKAVAKEREEHGLTTKELRLLIALVEGEKAGASLMQGFRLPTEREQDTNAYYDKIIVKLEKLINKK